MTLAPLAWSNCAIKPTIRSYRVPRNGAGFRDHGELPAEASHAKPGNPARGDRYVVAGPTTTKECRRWTIHDKRGPGAHVPAGASGPGVTAAPAPGPGALMIMEFRRGGRHKAVITSQQDRHESDGTYGRVPSKKGSRFTSTASLPGAGGQQQL